MVKRSRELKQPNNCSKYFQNIKKRNVVTGNESWVLYFEAVRKVSNKYSRRLAISKSTSAKKVFYAIFFFAEGIAIQVSVKKGKSWVHYFEAVRKVSNKIWATKNSKGPLIAKSTLSAKKVLYAIFFFGEAIAIQVPVKKDKRITGKYYKAVAFKKLKKILSEMAPIHRFQTCPTSTFLIHQTLHNVTSSFFQN